MSADSTALGALHALRRRRKLNRLGDLEWFDAAYKVYLVALFGGGGVLWLASAIGDTEVGASTAADVARHGPAVLGLLGAVAVLLGLRNGAQGGPLALEEADVVHVMLAPVDRRQALLRPAFQRVRSALASSAGLGAVAGVLAGYRLPGTPPAWALGGALFAATLAALWAGCALVAHALRPPLWTATLAGLALTAWQAAAVAWHTPGPGNTAGSLALWGWRQHPADLAATGAGVVLVAAGFALLARTSLDALARRSSLVAQLRFAVTMQDLRTVILLRRQLNQERMRNRPWMRLPGLAGRPELRRSWHSHLRLPLTRLVRMTALAGAIGVAAGVALRGTTAAVLLAAVLAFLLGLESLEPLSQEVDQPDRTDSLPVDRGGLMSQLLLASLVVLVPFAAVAGATAVLTVGSPSAIAPAAILALPLLLAGACGGAVSITRDAPDPFKDATTQAFVPPEMAGMATVMRVLVPLIVSLLGVSPLLIVRQAARHGQSLAGGAARAAIGSILVVAGTSAWVHYRDRIRAKFRAFLDEGRSYTANQRTM